MCYCISWGQAKDSVLLCTAQLPQQSIIQPEVSVVLTVAGGPGLVTLSIIYFKAPIHEQEEWYVCVGVIVIYALGMISEH